MRIDLFDEQRFTTLNICAPCFRECFECRLMMIVLGTLCDEDEEEEVVVEDGGHFFSTVTTSISSSVNQKHTREKEIL